MRFLKPVAVAVLILVVTAGAVGTVGRTATFSIVAHDAAAGEWGVAVASKVLAVGAFVPWAAAGTGAAATQAHTNLSYGRDALLLLEVGFSAEQVVEILTELDEDRALRQLGLVDSRGAAAAFTGEATTDWAGHRLGAGYCVQGNILVGEEVLEAMAAAYEDAGGNLARRLLAALEAGDAAGGDSRGKQSAALLVVREGGGYQGVTDRLVDLRVDDDAQPVARLSAMYDQWEPGVVLGHYLSVGDPLLLERALEIVDGLEDGDLPAEQRAYAYNSAAWELATRGLKPERALELARRAHELLPEEPNILDTLAEAHFVAGDPTAAVEWEQRALELDPENEFFREQLVKFEAALAE